MTNDNIDGTCTCSSNRSTEEYWKIEINVQIYWVQPCVYSEVIGCIPRAMKLFGAASV